MMAKGGALVIAAREVVRKGTELAAKDLEVAPNDLEFSKGRFRVKGTDVSVAMEELAKKYGSALDSRGEIPLPRSFPSGAHVAEVEIDPETGVVRILRYTAVDDCGRIINHVLLDGQLHGGIAQGIGQAMGEHAIYDQASGQLLTGTFMDYEMPRADELIVHERLIAFPLDPMHQRVAKCDHFVRRQARAAESPQADAERHGAALLIQSVQLGTDSLDDRQGRVDDRSGEEYREFVASEPRDGVGFAQAAFYRFDDLAQKQVAPFMPEPVVDRFEIVEIDIRYRERDPGALVSSDLRHERLGERSAVRDPRQPVDACSALFPAVHRPERHGQGDDQQKGKQAVAQVYVQIHQ